MYDRYIITGATGFLGRAVAEELVRRGAQVYALVLDNDPYKALLPKEVKAVTGGVCTESTLASLFEDADSRTCVIHCAGIVSVASRPGATIYQVNVGGTRNIIRQCTAHRKTDLYKLRSCHTGKAVWPRYDGGLHIIPRACGRRIRQEQSIGNGADIRRRAAWAKRKRCVPIGHNWAGRCSMRKLHGHGKSIPCREAAHCRSRRI